MLMRNIKRACFTALDSSVNNVFKVSNVVNGHKWHADMKVMDILNQPNNIYGKPTSAALESNNNVFRSPYSAANAPKVLFCRIEDCAKVALLGKSSCTDKQLILTAIRLLLGTGLYVCTFKDWDLLVEANQTWIELRCIIQEVFQRHLNATAHTSGHQGYAPALPYMMNNAFGALGHIANDNGDNSANTVPTQVAALTLRSQLTANTVANTLPRQDQLYQQLAHQQTLLHANQHQILDQLAALSFNANDMGQGHVCCGGGGCNHAPPAYMHPSIPVQGTAPAYNSNFEGRGRGCRRGQGRATPSFVGGVTLPLGG
jgi:hypothetical protein